MNIAVIVYTAIVACGNLSGLEHGRVVLSANGLTALYSCDLGYSLMGSATRTCSNGRWLGTKPACELIGKMMLVMCFKVLHSLFACFLRWPWNMCSNFSGFVKVTDLINLHELYNSIYNLALLSRLNSRNPIFSKYQRVLIEFKVLIKCICKLYVSKVFFMCILT